MKWIILASLLLTGCVNTNTMIDADHVIIEYVEK